MSRPTESPASEAWEALQDELDLRRTRASVLQGLFGEEVEPTRLGRFEIVGSAGRGAMGRVYVAHDPELDRRVAIKVMRQFAPDPEEAERQRERMIREARAMAKIQHPNVISVHEVSRHDADVFVVMEYVSGPNLRAWLEDGTRTWKEIVHVFVGAGRGLAAAHVQQLVHRDFKPDNVIVTAEQRAIVLDFGLARPPVESLGNATEPDQAGLALTAGPAGTPAYMAPEQLRGVAADAGSDQFSFCVALFEALHGRRPFVAESMEAVLAKIEAGPTPSKRRLPEWLTRAVHRGLSPAPQDRWPSMDALVHELERRRLSAPMVLGGAAGIALAAGIGAGAAQWADEDTVRCDRGASRVHEVWDDAQKQTVRTAFRDQGPAYAAAVAERVTADLDRWADRWAEGYDEACAATHLRGEQSDALLDQRMACLDRGLAELHAAVDVLGQADEAVIRRALTLVRELPSADDCADLEALRSAAPLPSDPATRESIDAAEGLLAEATAQRFAGHFAEVEAALKKVEAMQAARSYGPIEARYRFEYGRLLEDKGDPKAERALLDAVSTAEINHEDRLAASCWRILVRGTKGDKDADRRAEGYLERFAAAVGRIGSPTRERARLERARAAVAQRAGSYQDNAEHLEKAIAITEGDPTLPDDASDMRVDLAGAWFLLGRYGDAAEEYARAAAGQAKLYGPDHPFTARTLGNRGTALVAMGHNREAIEALTAARDAIRRGVGRDDASVAMTTNTLASAHYQLGEFERARDLYAEAIRIYEATLGPVDARLGPPLANLARCQSQLGQHEDAVASARRAVELVTEAKGADHIELATLQSGLGHVLTRAEQPEAGLAAHREALRIRRTQLGEDHAETAYSEQAMADTLRMLGRNEEALELALAASKTLEQQLGSEHPQLASALLSVGRSELALGRRTDAVAHLERALKIYETAEAPPEDVEHTRQALAEARQSAG